MGLQGKALPARHTVLAECRRIFGVVRSAKLASAKRAALTVAGTSLLLLISILPAQAQTEKLLYSFCPTGILTNCTDGVSPQGPLIIKGNYLIGTAYQGGTNALGTVFKLNIGTGALTVLYSFGAAGDGCYPLAGVVADKEGNLYGTNSNCGASGFGTVYEISPKNVETVLFSFDAYDGAFPKGPLLIGSSGGLYGTTSSGEGADAYGNVFEISGGTETVLDAFNGGSDGANPGSSLITDKAGNLYGMTYGGGAYGYGSVFMLSPGLTETVLHSFNDNGIDGYNPSAGLSMNAKGDLFGTVTTGGAYGYGVVFELLRPAKSGEPWTETILYNFYYGNDGYYPNTTLIMDKKGNLYGTTRLGGTAGYGTVFELLVPAKVGDPWTETVLHNFRNNNTDASQPTGGLVMDSKGNLYGTGGNGANTRGAIFEVTP